MLGALGDLLPFAAFVALSPFTIIAVVLMLMSPRPLASGFGFTLGLVLALAVVAGIATGLASLIPEGDDGPSPVIGLITIGLGIACLVLGARKWGARPASDEETTLPSWMSGLDGVSTGRAVLLGAAIGGPKPKSLILSVGAGLSIAYHVDTVAQAAISIVIYSLIASSSALILVIMRWLSPTRMASALEALRTWLVQHNAAIVSITLLLIGTVLIGTGLGEL